MRTSPPGSDGPHRPHGTRPAAKGHRRKPAPQAGPAAQSRFSPPRLRLPRSRGALIAAALAAVLVVAGGGTAFALDKRITLNVDGETRTVHTFGATVQDVLDSEGVTLAEHDAVAPAPDTELGAGAQVLVRSGREFTLTVDERESTHWVTALTVAEALDQLDLDPDTLTLSVPLTATVPTGGLTVEGDSARHLVILRDRVRTEVRTNAETVAEVLAASDITLGEHDSVTPGLEEEPVNGMVIRVVQLIGEPRTEEVPIEAEVEERDNPDLPEGETNVVTEPVDGVKEVTYGLTLKEGEETEQVISEEVIEEPVKGVTEVGTKEPEVDPNVGGDADTLNWAALADCESTGNPTAVNPAGYYGLYQFSLPTWQSAGGSGLPSDASPDEQTMRAKTLYNMVDGNWQSQWPSCGPNLFN